MIKALSIAQPYPTLIMLPDGDPRKKRIENRTWSTKYRGPLVIHAGKSLKYLERDDDRPGYDTYGFKISKLVFGAILGTCELVDCIEYHRVYGRRFDPPLTDANRWIASHQHTEGPFLWVLANIEPLAQPIPYRGALGLFNVPDVLFSVPVWIEEVAKEEYVPGQIPLFQMT